MNREIKFRAQRTDTKEFVYGYYRKNTFFDLFGEKPKEIYTKHFICCFDNINKFDDIFEQVEVIPETVGQFTGLLDKNGKEIYEGDVIKHDLGHEMFTKLNWQVVFEFGAFQLRNPLYDLPISFVYHAFASIENDSIISDEEYNNHLEIIGNVYENPNPIN